MTKQYEENLREKFPVGCRVQLSVEGIRNFPRYARFTGSVVRCTDFVTVKWDELKSLQKWSDHLLERL